MTGFVLNMTRFVLNKIGFVLNMNICPTYHRMYPKYECICTKFD